MTTPDDDLIERVARAMDECPEWPAKTYRARVARAAIEVMREPTWAMTREGLKHVTCDHAWSAMIDAALNPSQEDAK